MSEPILELKNITKSFGDEAILKGISLQVDPGEFITLLGSSGCGKTTTLRIVAGLESADSGTVLLEGKDVTNEPPERRNVNMVFQNYALFPHMTVEGNIGYALRLRGEKKAEIRTAVAQALELVRLPGFEQRRPSELSGGQRQRVAIARAIVNEPRVLLLDEPLGALDLQLRRQMQIELKRLQKQLGITFIYITHDQEEALNMSDRIAVMKNGVFQQIDAPSVIYDRPKNVHPLRRGPGSRDGCGQPPEGGGEPYRSGAQRIHRLSAPRLGGHRRRGKGEELFRGDAAHRPGDGDRRRDRGQPPRDRFRPGPRGAGAVLLRRRARGDGGGSRCGIDL